MLDDRARHALVVDDHPLVARGIAEYLVSHCGFAAAHTAAHGEAGLQRLASDGPPALAVVDFWLTDGAALALVDQLARRTPGTRVVVMSGDEDPRIQRKVREAGAHGFLRKDAPPDDFARAVSCVLSGGTWFAKPGADTAAQPLQPARRELPIHAQDLGLTSRQGEVLGLMLRGFANKRIARDLDLSESTVKEHVTGILARLGVATRVEAISLLQGRRLEA